MNKKKYIYRLVAAALLLFGFFSLSSFRCTATEKQSAAAVESRPQDNIFKAGERIKFGVYSTGIKVGTGELVYNGLVSLDSKKLESIEFSLRTLSVRDKETVYGSLDFVFPHKVERELRIFGKDEKISEIYSDDHKSVRISKAINNAALPEQVLKGESGLCNVLLLLYFLRNDGTLAEGKVYKIALPTQNFDLIVKDVRKIKTRIGFFDAYYLESKPAKYKIWLSTKPDRLPLKLQGLVAGGMLYLLVNEVSDR